MGVSTERGVSAVLYTEVSPRDATTWKSLSYVRKAGYFH